MSMSLFFCLFLSTTHIQFKDPNTRVYVGIRFEGPTFEKGGGSQNKNRTNIGNFSRLLHFSALLDLEPIFPICFPACLPLLAL